MTTVSLVLDDEIGACWQRLADEHGLDQNALMSAALIDRLEELEDFYVVKERLAKPFEAVSGAEVWRRLELDH